MHTLSKNAMRYGTDAPLPESKTLTAGALQLSFEEGTLRSIFYGPYEIVRSIYVAVRDRDWGTVPGKLSNVDAQELEEGFSVRFVSVHEQGDIHFSWAGSIQGNADGTLVFEMDGTAHSTFLKNRIGFCILHPMELAGTTVTVHTTEGDVSGVFPEFISPHQPFRQMKGLHYSLEADVTVDMSFEGDVFEMEDQRNWTDASYKTYCTPLSLPFPAKVFEGQRICQRIKVMARNRDGLTQPTNLDNKVKRIVVEPSLIGVGPKIGLGYTKPISSDVLMERFKELRPNHLRISLDMAAGDNEWELKLNDAISQAKSVGASLHGEVVIGEGDTGLEELMQYLGVHSSPMSHLFVFHAKTHLAGPDLLRKARSLAEKHQVCVQIGGGTRAFFTELNRAQLPLQDMDCVGYTLNPQVHAFDNQSLMETLSVQAETVKTARQKIGADKELVVGPITFKMYLNPNATSDEPISIEDTIDVRQGSLFGAAWTVGSFQYLMASDADAITYFETTGPLGLMDTDGRVFPLYHVFRDIADATKVLPIKVSDKTNIGAVAVRTADNLRVLVANLKSDKITVELELSDAESVLVRYLDENTFMEATENVETFRSSGSLIPIHGGVLNLTLLPYAVATIEV